MSDSPRHHNHHTHARCSLFKPILHIVLLIWKNSAHYNTPARLVVLMREICNSIINQVSRAYIQLHACACVSYLSSPDKIHQPRNVHTYVHASPQARKYVSGEQIFDLIDKVANVS